MQTLLNKSNIDNIRLRNYILRTVAQELSALTVPCTYPKFKKDYYEMLHHTGLVDSDVKSFIKRFYIGSKAEAQSWNLINDPSTNLNIFIMYYFLKVRDMSGFLGAATFYILRQYSNLLHKMIRFCDPGAFKYALETISKTHLFVREKSISNALYYLSKEIQKKYTSDIASGNNERIVKMIFETRTRISQSVKSFAEAYYKSTEEGTGLSTIPETSDDQESVPVAPAERYVRLIDDLAKKITVYKFIDPKSVKTSKDITKISDYLAQDISTYLCDIGYVDLIKTIMKLFINQLSSISSLCGNDYFDIVKKLMSIKRTTELIYFKQQVQILLNKIVQSNNVLNDKFEKLTPQSKYMTSMFLGLYLTSVLRHSLCG